MLRKLLMLGTASLLGLAAVGCTLHQQPLKQSKDCNRLRSQYIYNTTNPNFQADWVTDSQKDALKEQLRKNNCD